MSSSTSKVVSHNHLSGSCLVLSPLPDLMITVLWQAISLQNIPVTMLLKHFIQQKAIKSALPIILTVSTASGYVIQ